MTGRELALTIWLMIGIIVILILSIKNDKIRLNVLDIFKSILSLFKVFIMQILILYTITMLILFIYLVRKWNMDISLIYTFLIFTSTTYIPIILNVIQDDENIFEYKRYYQNLFSLSVIGGVLVTSYTFNFFIEFLLIVPLLLLLGLVKGLSNYSRSTVDIEKYTDKFIAFIGLVMLGYWVIQFSKNISDLLTIDFWLSLTIDFWGIIVYIPVIILLPYFLSVEKELRYYDSSNCLEYIKLPFSYLLLNKKYKQRKEITTFNIYKIDLISKPYHVFSVYADLDKNLDIERLNYDVHTFSLKLRSGNFDKDKMKITNKALSQHNKVRPAVIYFYFSIKGEKRQYSWYKIYMWRDSRLNQRYMPVHSNWSDLGDDLFVNAV